MGGLSGAGPGPSGKGGLSGKGGQGGGGKGGASTDLWQPISGACLSLRRLNVLAFQGKAFSWTSCGSSILGCQEAVFQAPFLPKQLTVAGVALDDGTDKWLALQLGYFPGDQTYFVVARIDGTVLAAFRADAGECQFFAPTLANGTFAIPIGTLVNQTQWSVGALVGSLSNGTSNNEIPTLRTVPLSGTPVTGAITNSRVSLVWGAGILATSVDSGSGSDEKVIAHGGDIGELGNPATFPGSMILAALSSPWSLFRTDGSSLVSQYLADPVADLMSPVFTGAHITWVRGTEKSGEVSWNQMEIWASPFGPDSTALKPKLVAKWPFVSVIPLVKGGFDYYGSPSTVDPNPRSVHTWHVPDGAHRVAKVADSLVVPDFYGVLRDEIVFPVRPNMAAHVSTVYRVPIASMAVVP